MLLLVFHVKNDRYAINTASVVEVIPLINLQSLPMAPDYVAGIFNYRGISVPVIDLCQYFKKVPHDRFYNTRIILIKYKSNSDQILGLIAENVTDVIQQDETNFIESGMKFDESPFLGKLVIDDNNVIQNIEPETLISEELSELLFSPHETC